MITLITGVPGSGKTLMCIDKVMNPVMGTSVEGFDDDGNSVQYPRKIFSNIDGLLLDHEMIDREWLENLHENKTTGAFIVFDEVQRVWPNRPNGSKKPLAVEYLETHRHDGVDIVLLTQNPQLLDPAVRALVGRHMHMRRLGSTNAAFIYEWDSCSNTLNFKSAFQKRFYRYNRKIFKLYRSSRMHTKQGAKLPFAVYFFFFALLFAAYYWHGFYQSMTDKAGALEAPPTGGVGEVDGNPSLPTESAGVKSPLTKEQYLETFKPRIEGLPYTASRYDEITRPVRAPIPAACMSSKSQGCKCFSQQGTPLHVPELFCRQFVSGGMFIDFNNDDGAAVEQAAPVPATSAPAILSP